MAVSDYPGLIATIRDYLIGQAITDDAAATFVALAEAEMARTLRIRQMVRRATTTLVGGYTELPTDFLSPINLSLLSGPGTPLRMISPDEADIVRSRIGGATTPAYYCLLGSEIEVLPNPIEDTDVELVYHGRVPALSYTAPVNAILTLAPDLYLQASLAHSAMYIADPQRGAFWAAEAQRLMQQLNADSAAATYGASPLIMRAHRSY